MVDGRTEQNLERLRAAFLLTERHAKSLAQEVIDLKLKVARLEGRVLSQDELQLSLPEAEEIVRRAAKKVNEKVQEFQEQYAAKDKQDYLAMCALMSEVEVLANKEKVVISDTTFFDKLREIEELLSDTVSR